MSRSRPKSSPTPVLPLSRTTATVAALVLGLAGCDHFDVREAAGHLPPYQRSVDLPKNDIDRALERCPDKTEDAETVCVKAAVGGLTMAALEAQIPGCRSGALCVYHHRTDDRLGYVSPIAADFVVRWKVGVDLRKAKTVADAPVSVAVE